MSLLFDQKRRDRMREAMTTLWLFGSHAVTAAVVLGLFWAATARPNRIHNPNTRTQP